MTWVGVDLSDDPEVMIKQRSRGDKQSGHKVEDRCVREAIQVIWSTVRALSAF